MNRNLLLILSGLAAIASPLAAQSFSQRARIAGNGNSNQGKCTIEVVVDGAADVEIRGDNATLRNLSGRPAEWRRFECSGVMPPNPADFRFAGVDGRGRQSLIRDPRNGGVAVVRIEDPEGGAQGYTFDIVWSAGSRPYTRGPNPYNPGYSAAAVRNCEEAVRRQAYDRFRSRDITVQARDEQNNPGPRDQVYGTVNVRRGPDGGELYDFSCAVNMNDGRVQVSRIEQTPSGRSRSYGDRGPSSNRQAIQNCQAAVEERMRREGAGRVEFDSIRADDQPGRNDWVIGSVRNGRGDPFNFSCSVNMNNGDVRSVDLNRR